jgi:hypothetical protein
MLEFQKQLGFAKSWKAKLCVKPTVKRCHVISLSRYVVDGMACHVDVRFIYPHVTSFKVFINLDNYYK